MALEPSDSFSFSCPNCRARYVYRQSSLNAEGQVQCQNCGLWISTDNRREAPLQPVDAWLESYIPWNQRSGKATKESLKIFVHGFIFSLLSLGVYFVWVFLMVILIYVGGFLGLILSLVIFAGMFGGINMAISSGLWNIRCRAAATSVLGHGGLLFVFLLLTGLVSAMIGFMFALGGLEMYILGQVIGILLFSVIDGYVCRFTALQFEVGEAGDGIVSDEYMHGTCSNCNATYSYHPTSIAEDGTVACQNCGRRFKLGFGPEVA
ncbi:MAG: MJ0042-type zinc finger domain-containing protein [Candidatus Thorarchaeota archaeon]